jgi:hypothetical protein
VQLILWGAKRYARINPTEMTAIKSHALIFYFAGTFSWDWEKI